MKTPLIVGAAVAACLVAAPTMAQSSTQPPMNNFYQAFYDCGNGNSFLVTYDSNTPTTATLTTSNHNKEYVLKRTPVANGAQFAGDMVKFWTNGKTVTVAGTQDNYQSCALKTG